MNDENRPAFDPLVATRRIATDAWMAGSAMADLGQEAWRTANRWRDASDGGAAVEAVNAGFDLARRMMSFWMMPLHHK